MGFLPSPIRRTSALLVGLSLSAGCVQPETGIPTSESLAIQLSEQSVQPLPLTGPISVPEAEISGMAWYGDNLVILPQYPERFAEGEVPQIFVLLKSSIVEVLERRAEELEPIPIPFIAPNFRAEIAGYQGFEAIGFAGNQAFLTIEADTGTETAGYLVRGQVVGDLQRLQMEADPIVQIPSQSGLGNMAEESLVVTNGSVLTLHEVNGADLNPNPLAHRFSFDLEPLGTVPFPNLEYRVTDATGMDEAGQFWVINYFWEGDLNLKPEADPLVQRYGMGQTHAEQETVERIVALRYDGDQITRINEPPLLLTLADDGRNWEAIVHLDDRGFLVMTDRFPETVLAFVEDPQQQE